MQRGIRPLILVTSKNALFRERLMERGFSVREFSFPPSDADCTQLRAEPSGCAAIVEVDDRHAEEGASWYELVRQKSEIVCAIGDVSGRVRGFLMDQGIADAIRDPNAEKLAEVIDRIAVRASCDAGRFLIFEEDPPVRAILSSILSRFGYSADFTKTNAGFFEAAERAGVRFVLVNLSAQGLDLNGLVRGFHARQRLREIPFLAYKDMREGLFVHELVTGLNRLTRYILGIDELYGFLVRFLFSKACLPLIAELKRVSCMDALSGYGPGTLAKAFFTMERELFNQPDILEDERVKVIEEISEGIRSLVLRTESLRWLRVPLSKQRINTEEREESKDV